VGSASSFFIDDAQNAYSEFCSGFFFSFTSSELKLFPADVDKLTYS